MQLESLLARTHSHGDWPDWRTPLWNSANPCHYANYAQAGMAACHCQLWMAPQSHSAMKVRADREPRRLSRAWGMNFAPDCQLKSTSISAANTRLSKCFDVGSLFLTLRLSHSHDVTNPSHQRFHNTSGQKCTAVKNQSQVSQDFFNRLLFQETDNAQADSWQPPDPNH